MKVNITPNSMKKKNSVSTAYSALPKIEYIPTGMKSVARLSSPWSNSSPRGPLLFVRRACFPSVPSPRKNRQLIEQRNVSCRFSPLDDETTEVHNTQTPFFLICVFTGQNVTTKIKPYQEYELQTGKWQTAAKQHWGQQDNLDNCQPMHKNCSHKRSESQTAGPTVGILRMSEHLVQSISGRTEKERFQCVTMPKVHPSAVNLCFTFNPRKRETRKEVKIIAVVGQTYFHNPVPEWVS